AGSRDLPELPMRLAELLDVEGLSPGDQTRAAVHAAPLANSSTRAPGLLDALERRGGLKGRRRIAPVAWGSPAPHVGAPRSAPVEASFSTFAGTSGARAAPRPKARTRSVR